MWQLISDFFKNLFGGSNSAPATGNPVNNGAPDLPITQPPVTTDSQGATPGKSHPDLAKWKPEWTTGVLPTIQQYLPTLSKAQDIEKIYPDYSKLTEQNKAYVWVELFKATTKYESDFSPTAASVDVGTKDNKNTWSIGLLQMSVVDQANLGIKLGYVYDDLIKAIPNLILGTRVMANQVAKRGVVMIDKDSKGNPGTYWSTLQLRGKHDRTSAIMAYVQYLKFDTPATSTTLPTTPTTPAPVPVDSANAMPWYDIATGEIGVKEIAGKQNTPRIVEYHSVTTLHALDDETSWCASFVSWVLLKAGYKSLRTAWSRDYMTYGLKLDKPKKGCIIVFERNGAGGDSHVAFYTGQDDGAYHLVLGGNMSNSVCIKGYAKKDVLAYRWPVKN